MFVPIKKEHPIQIMVRIGPTVWPATWSRQTGREDILPIYYIEMYCNTTKTIHIEDMFVKTLKSSCRVSALTAVDGVWSDWGAWSSCSVTCGDGQYTRNRTCDNPAPSNGGNDCPNNPADATETGTCSMAACPRNKLLHWQFFPFS